MDYRREPYARPEAILTAFGVIREEAETFLADGDLTGDSVAGYTIYFSNLARFLEAAVEDLEAGKSLPDPLYGDYAEEPRPGDGETGLPRPDLERAVAFLLEGTERILSLARNPSGRYATPYRIEKVLTLPDLRAIAKEAGRFEAGAIELLNSLPDD